MNNSLNLRQIELFNNLMKLTSESEAFFYKDFPWRDHDTDTRFYRIFNYRLASYTEWLRPDALECRGHTFEVDRAGNPIRMCCWTPNKFFNVGENPMTENLDFNDPKQVMIKMDGSLISSFTHFGRLILKSKGSLTSDQAIDSLKWINRVENLAFKSELERMSSVYGYTVNMEWVSPNNRIVIGYDEPRLVVLSVRDNYDGRYVSKDHLSDLGMKETLARWVETLDVHDPIQFVKDIAGMSGIEGFVIELASGQFVKTKTAAYLALHKTKDSINSPRRLYEVVLSETSDDLKAMFHDDALVVRQIVEMEEKVFKLYDHLCARVEGFYESNKSLQRKDYAIKGQSELNSMEFGLAMSLFSGKNVDFKDFMKKKWKEFGIKDEEVLEE